MTADEVALFISSLLSQHPSEQNIVVSDQLCRAGERLQHILIPAPSTAAKTARDSGVIQYAAAASIDSRRLFYRSANLLLWYKGGEEKGKMKHKDCSVDQKREVEERKEQKRQTDGQDERGTHRQRVWGE